GEGWLDHFTGLENRTERDALQIKKHGQGMSERVDAGAPDGCSTAGPWTQRDHSLCLQHTEAFAQCRAADRVVSQKLGFRAEQVTGLQPAVYDAAHQGVSNLFRLVSVGRSD